MQRRGPHRTETVLDDLELLSPVWAGLVVLASLGLSLTAFVGASELPPSLRAVLVLLNGVVPVVTGWGILREFRRRRHR